MGEIADDIISGECCALCGCYFVGPDLDSEGHQIAYEHGYPVACEDCFTPECGYPLANADTF